MFKTCLLFLAGAAILHAAPAPSPTVSLTPAQIEAGCTIDMIPFRPECHVADSQDNTLRIGATPAPTPILDMGCHLEDGSIIPDCNLQFGGGQLGHAIDGWIDRLLSGHHHKHQKTSHHLSSTETSNHMQTTTKGHKHQKTKSHKHTTTTVNIPTETTSHVPTTTTSSLPTETTSHRQHKTTAPMPTQTMGVSTETTTHKHTKTKGHKHTKTKGHKHTKTTVDISTQTTSHVPTTAKSSLPTETTSHGTTRSKSPMKTTTKHEHTISTSTSSTAAPSATPTDDAHHNVTDVIKTLKPNKKDRKALQIGLGVGLGAGIPGAALLGWLGKNIAAARGAPHMYKEWSRSMHEFQMNRVQDWVDQIPDPNAQSGSDISGSDADLGSEVADSVDELYDTFREQGYDANEAIQIMQELEDYIAPAEASAGESAGASSVAEAASSLADIDLAGVRTAADVASSGASPETVADALLRAGVPAGDVAYTSEAVTAAINAAPSGSLGNPAYSAALNVISKAVNPQSVAAAEAATAAVDGVSGEALEPYLSSTGIPLHNLESTAAAVKDAIQEASASGSDPVRAALDTITHAFPPGSSDTSSGAIPAPNTAVSEAVLDVIGASYNFWHGYSYAVYDAFQKLDGKAHSKTLEDILANGPPPAMEPYRGIAFPYRRGKPQGHSDKSSNGKHEKGSDKPTSTSSSPKPTPQSPSPTVKGPEKPTGTVTRSTAPPAATQPALPDVGDCMAKWNKETVEVRQKIGKILLDHIFTYLSQPKPLYLLYLRRTAAAFKDFNRLWHAVPHAICRVKADPNTLTPIGPSGISQQATIDALLGIWSVLPEANLDQ